MRRIALVAALLLGGSVFMFGQAGQGPTPPGPDVVGSDRPVQRSGSSARSDAQQNQRMTNSTGTSWGNERPRVNAGESVYSSRTAQGNRGVVGQQGEESAISGRQRAHNRGYSSKDTSVEPMRNGGQSNAIGSRSEQETARTKAGNTSRRTSHRAHRRHKRNTDQQTSEPRQ